MSHLKIENLNKCVSLLREFIDGTGSPAEKKEMAVLALNHLQNITAGSGPISGGGTILLGPECSSRPRADG